MKTPAHKILTHSLIYGSGELLNKGLAFLLIPLYSRTFNPAEYGTLQLLIIAGTFLTIVTQLGLSSAIFRTVFSGSTTSASGVYATATRFLVCFAVMASVPLLLLVPHVAPWLAGASTPTQTLYWVILAALLKNLAVIPAAKLRIEERPLHYSLYNTSRYATQLALILLFVLKFKLGIQGVILADVSVGVVWGLIGLWILRHDLSASSSWIQLKEMLAFGLPLVPAALALYLLNMADHYLLKALGNAESVGLYAMGYKLGMIMAIAVGAFQQSWAATMFKVSNGAHPDQAFPRLFNGFSGLLLLLGLGLSLFAHEILVLFSTEQYYESATLVPWVAGGYYFLGLYYFTAIGIHLRRKTRVQPLIVGLAAALNILLNLWMIPRWGMHGAAVATFASFAVMGLLAARASQRYYFIPYQWKRNGILFFLAGSLVFLDSRVTLDGPFFNLLAKFFLLLGFTWVLFYCNHWTLTKSFTKGLFTVTHE